MSRQSSQTKKSPEERRGEKSKQSDSKGKDAPRGEHLDKGKSRSKKNEASSSAQQSKSENKQSRGTSDRGFASMDPERQREIAGMGGRAAHEQGTAHEWTSEEARKAGRKGGKAAHAQGTAHEWGSEEAREAGRKGGKIAHAQGTAHEWTSEEARKAGRKGGQTSHGKDMPNKISDSKGEESSEKEDKKKRSIGEHTLEKLSSQGKYVQKNMNEESDSEKNDKNPSEKTSSSKSEHKNDRWDQNKTAHTRGDYQPRKEMGQKDDKSIDTGKEKASYFSANEVSRPGESIGRSGAKNQTGEETQSGTRQSPEPQSGSKGKDVPTDREANRPPSSSEGGGNSEGPKFHTLFLEQLKDIYWAERHLLRAIPEMQRAATSRELAEAFEEHLSVTEKQVDRLDRVFEILNERSRGEKCEGMAGLIEEGETIISDTESDTMVRDAGLIIAAQKIEHYEIATYGSLKTLAHLMGNTEIVDLLGQTLEEEKEANNRLTEIAMSSVNEEAVHE